MSDDLPPGHPAGSDPIVDTGDVLAGRDLGSGGAVGSRLGIGGEIRPDDVGRDEAERDETGRLSTDDPAAPGTD